MKGWKNLPKQPTKKQVRPKTQIPFIFPGVKANAVSPTQIKIRIVSDPIFAMVHWVGFGKNQSISCPFVVCGKFDSKTTTLREDKICISCRVNKPIAKYFAVARDLKRQDYPLAVVPISPDLLEEIEKQVDLEKIDKYIIVIESRRSKDNPRKIIYNIKSKESEKIPPQQIYADAAEMLEELKLLLGIEEPKNKSVKEKSFEEEIEEEEAEAEESIEDKETESEEVEEEDEPFPKKKSSKEKEDISEDEINEEDIEDIDDLDE